jgi:predicted O-methyltransferase YrrM
MNEVLQSIVSSGSVTTEDGQTRTLRDSISRQEGEFLQEMIRSARPQVSVEVGCAYGISSLYICEALREVNAAKHIIMDPFQHSTWEGIGLANLRKAGYLDLVDFHEAFSYQYLSQLTEEHVKIDFAFIDGNHWFDYVLIDFFLVHHLLRTGGIIVFDDLSYPAVRSVCRHVLSNHPYRCIGPHSRESPERAAVRNLLTRSRQFGIGALVRAPVSRVLAPAWRLLLSRVDKLVTAPLRHRSATNLTDLDLHLPPNSNYVAVQKFDSPNWRPKFSPLIIDVRLGR